MATATVKKENISVGCPTVSDIQSIIMGKKHGSMQADTVGAGERAEEFYVLICRQQKETVSHWMA